MDLNNINTEQINPRSLNIDEASTFDIVKIINKEDASIANCIEKILPDIAKAIDTIVEAFNEGGRLIYIGAGTSGRLGVLDASECTPTFNTPPGMVIGLIAGGNKALKQAVEGKEDDENQAIEDLKHIKLSNNDILVGLSASGRTPYVVSALKYANSIETKTMSIVCSKNSPIEAISKYPIVVIVGPEIIAGSTRMKAATAQKMILNMLSTASMIKTNKVFQNFMVDVQTTNKKLKERAKNIVIQTTCASGKEAEEALVKYKSAKAAIFSILTGIKGKKVFETLEHYNGNLKKAIKGHIKIG